MFNGLTPVIRVRDGNGKPDPLAVAVVDYRFAQAQPRTRAWRTGLADREETRWLAGRVHELVDTLPSATGHMALTDRFELVLAEHIPDDAAAILYECDGLTFWDVRLTPVETRLKGFAYALNDLMDALQAG